ncbi:MAG TPA: CHAD domain-containing protein [Candidatus Heimdallarchaeota archaeon]|nr:CHAD domain-containing protein [Candidatus Heimdallarchaeota archaeon]
MYPECLWTYYGNLQRIVEENYNLAVRFADVEGVHDMRVGIKRLRAYFNLIEWINPVFQAKQNLKPIRRLFKAAGKVRDIHVHQELLRRWATELDLEMSEYYNFLKQKETEERKRFADFAKKKIDLKVFQSNWILIQNVLAFISTEYIQYKSEERFKTQIEELIKFKEKENLGEEDYHSIRIHSKETRYTLEVLQTCFPPKSLWEKLNETLRKVHQALGRWHDNDVSLLFLDGFLLSYTDRSFFDRNSYVKFKKGLADDKVRQMAEFEQSWMDFLAVMK